VRRRRALRIGAAAIIAGTLATGALFARSVLLLPASPGDAAPVLVDVTPGMELGTIAALLQRKGVVRSAWGFELLARREGLAGSLEAGTYALAPGLAPRTVLQRIARGDVTTISVTIPEGSSAVQVVADLARAGFGGSGLASAVNDPALLAAAGLPAPAPGVRLALEGYLFPATYALPPNAAPDAIAATMLQRFRVAWSPQIAADAARTGLSMAQTVTLASIVQREVAQPAQMPLVAGVYLNRLRAGMDLDADPAVLYALGLPGQSGPLTAAELTVSSPYNTYRHRGLPPGPICNPGSAALAAAASPARTSALYFITTPSGALVLADTLAQQQANETRYLGG
jgi:UPF0755 protein